MVLIIYDKERQNGNERFSQLLGAGLSKRGIEFKTILDSEIDDKTIADCAIMRTFSDKLCEKLKQLQIPQLNCARMQRTANDKAATYGFAKSLGIPVLKHYVIKSSYSDIPIFTPFVAKSRFGHGGTQVFLVKNDSEYKETVAKIGEETFIAQECADFGKDKRVYVVGGKPIIAMLRTNENDFRSNYKLGGKALKVEVGEAESEYIQRIHGSIKTNFVGVDFVYRNNIAYLNEIEDIVGSRMVY
ncbi:MAG: ATP-grasp domain-containing protein, partial [Clostridia bacterium]